MIAFTSGIGTYFIFWINEYLIMSGEKEYSQDVHEDGLDNDSEDSGRTQTANNSGLAAPDAGSSQMPQVCAD